MYTANGLIFKSISVSGDPCNKVAKTKLQPTVCRDANCFLGGEEKMEGRNDIILL